VKEGDGQNDQDISRSSSHEVGISLIQKSSDERTKEGKTDEFSKP
jgi:hypothetical protein